VNNGTENRIEFVNRVTELAILEQMLEPERMPALIFLRSSRGYGKSRLTDEFMARNADGAIAYACVDPSLRPNAGPSTVHEGYFLQQCAATIDALAERLNIDGLDRLEAFLKERRWTTIRQKKLGDAVRKFPSLENLYGVAFDYIERLFVFGTFGREQLINSDSREAVVTCEAYVDAMLERTRLVLIVRQAELIDHQSLKALLAFNRASAANLLLFEYSAPEFAFSVDHDKIIERELAVHPNGHIFQLTKLEPQHLERILAQLQLPTQVIEWTTSAQWDGDLRRLTLFEHTFTVHSRTLGSVEQLRLRGPEDLYAAVTAEVAAMGATERVIVALAAADPHRIERAVLLQVAQRLLPLETLARLNMLLDGLANGSGLLSVREGSVGLAAAELLPAIERATGYGAARVLAEAGLRDFYVEALRGQDCVMIAPAMAMRRALSLAGRTQDPQLLISLLAECDARIAGVNDQGLYVDIVADVLQPGHDLLASEHARLTRWAAGLAYDICDFRKCRALLERSEERDAVDVILLASCMIEDGDHVEARAALSAIDRNASVGMMLAIDVLEGTMGLDAGAWDGARRLLQRAVEDGREAAPAMAAHGLRLLPELLGHPECTAVALESVELFHAAGLPRCAAFSAMSASRFLAREGRIAEARTMIARTDILRDHVRDEHMVRNNRALIELLTPSPDFGAIIAELQLALRTSRDDFSDLTILCNLALARAGAGALDDALDCVSRGIPILDAPGFAERDVYWPVCFNFGWVLDLAGRRVEAEQMRTRPYQTGWRNRSSDAYWAWRYGEVADADTELPYLHTFAYHPTALSHWQLDREAVATLSGGSPR
jgi:hypothetical protein